MSVRLFSTLSAAINKSILTQPNPSRVIHITTHSLCPRIISTLQDVNIVTQFAIPIDKVNNQRSYMKVTIIKTSFLSCHNALFAIKCQKHASIIIFSLITRIYLHLILIQSYITNQRHRNYLICQFLNTTTSLKRLFFFLFSLFRLTSTAQICDYLISHCFTSITCIRD